MTIPDPDSAHQSAFDACGSFLLAAQLARVGRYDEADMLLSRLPEDEASLTSVLDLRARIYVQRGRYVEAESCWLRALSSDPGNSRCRRALDALANERRFPAWLRVLVAACVAALFASTVLIPMLTAFEARYAALERRLTAVESVLPARGRAWELLLDCDGIAGVERHPPQDRLGDRSGRAGGLETMDALKG